MAIQLDIAAARKELQAQDIQAIERTTAITWGGRAAAAFRLAAEADDADGRRKWLMDGENYRQEALEHAAMTDDFDFLRDVAAALATGRSEALAIVRKA